MKKLILLSAIVMSGCSSPPEPPQVNWSDKPETMNSQLPDWQPTNQVVKSDKVTSTWMKVITNFSPENRLYDDSVFYAVAHSPVIIVETTNGGDFFIAKNGFEIMAHMALFSIDINLMALVFVQPIYILKEGENENHAHSCYCRLINFMPCF